MKISLSKNNSGVTCVHTADWHFGSSRYIPNYLERQIAGAKAVYDKAYKLGLNIVLVCGDLTEKDLRPHERDALTKLLLWADDKGFISLVCGGNHDQLSKGYSNLRYLEILYKRKRFKNTHVAVTDPLIVKVQEQDFLIFPGFYEGKNINKALKEWIKKCDVPPVVLMHEVVKGALADNGYKLEHGVRIDPDLGALYFACGDLHINQRLTGLKNGFYCGSPCQHDYGEELPKGFLVVDTDKPTKPKFVEITSVAPLVTIKSAKEIKEVREDAWIRIKSDSLIEDSDELPDRVLKVEYIPKKKKEGKSKETELDVSKERIVNIKELKRYLREETRLKGRALKIALRKAESYLTQVGG